MSSFDIRLRVCRTSTPDPERPGHMLTQERTAEIMGINVATIRRHEQNKRLPHPLIYREYCRIFPELCRPE